MGFYRINTESTFLLRIRIAGIAAKDYSGKEKQ
jgi:hypothetical protein